MNIGFLELILFLGISQGIFLASTLQFIHKNNKVANNTLSLLLLIISIMLLGRFCYFKYATNIQFYRFTEFVDIIIFFFGPLLYTYVRRLIVQDSKRFQLPFYHYTLPLFHFLFFLYTLSYSNSSYNKLLRLGFLNGVYFIVELLGVLSVIFYIFKSLILHFRFRKAEKNNLSYHQTISVYLHCLLLGISIFVTFWLCSFLNRNLQLSLVSNYINYNSVWVSISLFIYIVSFFSLKQPEIFRVQPLEKITEKKERIDKIELERLKKDLEFLMIQEKIYLDPQLSLTQLAKKLNTSTNNTSWLLNNVHKSSFYDYVNSYRVQAFIEKIHNGEHKKHTILALSLDVGFSSKSTFNKVFKETTQQTPSGFIKNIAHSS